MSSSDLAELAAIKQTIYAFNPDVTYAGTAVLIGKLAGGPLQYLHKLFVPPENVIEKVKEIIGFHPPWPYAEFFSLSDGATLFDNSLLIYGVRGRTTRDLSVQNIRPIGLSGQIGLQRRLNPDLECIEVGALSAATKSYSLKIDKSGRSLLWDPDNQERAHSSFLAMLLALVQILQQNCGPHGLLDPSAETLQTEIDSYICASRQ